MPEKKRKVYEVTEVNELTGNRCLLMIVRDRETAQWFQTRLETLMLDQGLLNSRVVITERDAEDDAGKEAEGI